MGKEAEQRIEFTKIKHVGTKVVSNDVISDDGNLRLAIEDFVNETTRMTVDAYTAESKLGTREVKVYSSPPTFKEWFVGFIYGREREHIFQIEVKDVLKQFPKELKDSYRIVKVGENIIKEPKTYKEYLSNKLK